MVCVSGDLLFTLSTGTLENIKREVKKIVSNSLLMAVMLLLVLHVSFSFVSSCVSLVCTHLMLKFFLYVPTSINPGSVALFHKLWFDLFISLSLEMVFPTTAPSSLGKKKKVWMWPRLPCLNLHYLLISFDICQLLFYVEQILCLLLFTSGTSGSRICHAHRLVIACQLSPVPAGPPVDIFNLNLYSFIYLWTWALLTSFGVLLYTLSSGSLRSDFFPMLNA